ncbi:hypothetical protein [Leisingera caerulea]|uniref:hypothetical protein n=1 Tax=Leisingera caerulea TaxID=506591 RepID=UPI0021A44AD9|nr:hypothetical protein [Leisingera caerulea]
MDQLTSKAVAIFSRPFTLPGFDETLPAGEYGIETELSAPPGHLTPQAWKASVLIQLHPRASHPGLARSLTVSLADLESAQAKDKLSGKDLSQFFLEEMLADPMVRLVMQADGVSEAQIRRLYLGECVPDQDREQAVQSAEQAGPSGAFAIQSAENEGVAPAADNRANKVVSPAPDIPGGKEPRDD